MLYIVVGGEGAEVASEERRRCPVTVSRKGNETRCATLSRPIRSEGRYRAKNAAHTKSAGNQRKRGSSAIVHPNDRLPRLRKIDPGPKPLVLQHPLQLQIALHGIGTIHANEVNESLIGGHPVCLDVTF